MTELFVAKQAGRLHDPEMNPRTDPRVQPRLLEALAGFGLDTAAGPPTIDRSAALGRLIESVAEQHAGFNGLYEALPNELPGDVDSAVTDTFETIIGVDGNEIELRIYRPVGVHGSLPCTVYIHGGGMVILDSFNKVHRRWCADLAATGMVVIGVDFRNAYTPAGMNPFPAGLNDCSSAVAWIDAHREALGISKIVLQGESGGANLVLATTLKAKQTGVLASIDGVYASVPYISGVYGTWDSARKLQELPSLYENDGYFINCEAMDLLVAAYDPNGANSENPLCWPYFAAVEDLRGLPPHLILADELDPLRDEGIAYYRNLLRAGVPAVGRVNLGLTHAAEFIFRQSLPEFYKAAIKDIRSFADLV